MRLRFACDHSPGGGPVENGISDNQDAHWDALEPFTQRIHAQRRGLDRKGRVSIADPGFGNRTMSVRDFSAAWQDGIGFIVIL